MDQEFGDLLTVEPELSFRKDHSHRQENGLESVRELFVEDA